MMPEELSFPFPEPPVYGKTVRIADDIRWLRMPLPLALNHINIYLVDSGDGWVIVDTGIKGQQVQDYWQQIFDSGLEGKPIVGVLVTHNHPDHLGQAGWLTDRLRVPFYMTHGEYMSGRAFASGPTGSDPWVIEKFLTGAGIGDEYIRQYRKGAHGFASMLEPISSAFQRTPLSCSAEAGRA